MLEDDLKWEMELYRDAENQPGTRSLWRGGSNPSRWGWKGAKWRMKKGGVDIEAIYETCIKPYAVKGTTALDIGTNGGFWLSKMLDGDVDRALGIDVLSATHLGFWEKLYHWHGPDILSVPDKVGFMQVSDFSLHALEDDSLNLVFSYDVFCHISYPGAQEYVKNLFTKMKPGANAFIMIADTEKYPFERAANKGGQTWGSSLAQTAGLEDYEAVVADRDGAVSRAPGRWYFYGMDDFCATLEECGYEVVFRDAVPEGDTTNAIVHFRKPAQGGGQDD